MTLLANALEYHNMGFNLLPLKYKSKKPDYGKLKLAGLVKKDKVGVASWKDLQKKFLTVNQIKEFFSVNDKKMNLGVVLGNVSNKLACLDFDTRDSFGQWYLENSALAKSTAVQQSGRGFHVFVRYTLKELRVVTKPWGEIRGDGGYVVISPSVHPSGHEYAWINHPRNGIQTVDPSVLFSLVKPEKPKRTRVGKERLTLAESMEKINKLPMIYVDDYHYWSKIGMILKNTYGDKAYSDWVSFSQKSDKFDLSVCESQWSLFSSTGSLTMGTVIYWLKKSKVI